MFLLLYLLLCLSMRSAITTARDTTNQTAVTLNSFTIMHTTNTTTIAAVNTLCVTDQLCSSVYEIDGRVAIGHQIPLNAKTRQQLCLKLRTCLCHFSNRLWPNCINHRRGKLTMYFIQLHLTRRMKLCQLTSMLHHEKLSLRLHLV